MSAILLDWLSRSAKPRQARELGDLTQGTEGDGKSFFAEMMRNVMGVSNVRMLNAQSLKHPSPTGRWASV
jgi:hypothetical protein